jgi:two-component system, NarL family, response regulator LiaR
LQAVAATPGPGEIRVVVVDDHEVFRSGLRELLATQGLDVVGEADSGEAAIDAVRRLAPDVVVMDLHMPGMGGVEATRRVAETSPVTRVLVLTGSEQEESALDAILAGAHGFLIKDAPLEQLVWGIRAAAHGEVLISPRMAARLVGHLRRPTSEHAAAAAIRAVLSDREIEVLRLLAQGKENAEIAADLTVSPKTIKNHISSILEKLHIENRIQAAVVAVRSGLA